MNKTSQLTLLGVLLLALTACSTATKTEVPSQPPVEPTSTVAVQVATPVDTVDYCLDCHSNKDQVVSLAKPEVVVESESKGVG